MRIRRQLPERHVLVGRPLHLPAAHHPQAVTVQEKAHHHRRLIGRHAPPIAFIGPVDQPEIEFLDHIGDEPRQVPLRQPVVQGWRQQQTLVQVVGPESFAHSHILRPDERTLKTFRSSNVSGAGLDEIYLRHTPRPHAGGDGEPGTAARTETGNRRGAAQGQAGTRQTGTAGGKWTHSARSNGRTGAEGAATRALVRLRDCNGEGDRGPVSLTWHVDAARRRLLERTRLGRRVLCSDHHHWSNGRIVHAFRGQWNVEELFRRAKKGGIAPWGPSHQWADTWLRLHTFATVIGLTLVSLVRLTLGNRKSAQSTMRTLSEVKATLVRVRTKERGRRATVMLAPDVTARL